MVVPSPRVPQESRRAIPATLTDEQRARLRLLLEDPDTWALRPGWHRYVVHGDAATLVDPGTLTRDQRIAALAWLGQQRHVLYRVLEGGSRAPAGWVESLPISRRLASS